MYFFDILRSKVLYLTSFILCKLSLCAICETATAAAVCKSTKNKDVKKLSKPKKICLKKDVHKKYLFTKVKLEG